MGRSVFRIDQSHNLPSQIFATKLDWLRADRVSASRPAKITTWANTWLNYAIVWAFRENNPDNPGDLLPIEKQMQLFFNADETPWDPYPGPHGAYSWQNWKVLRSVAREAGVDTDGIERELHKKDIRTAIAGRQSTLRLPRRHCLLYL